MKLSFYFDIYPWTKPNETIYASTSYEHKHSNVKRYRIDVEIPDPAEPDEIIKTNAIETDSNISKVGN